MIESEAEQIKNIQAMFGKMIFEHTPVAPKRAMLSDKEITELVKQSRISEDYNKCAEYLVKLVELAIWEKME